MAQTTYKPGEKKAVVVQAFNAYWDKHKKSVTARTLAKELGFETSYVHGVLHLLAFNRRARCDIERGPYNAVMWFPAAPEDFPSHDEYEETDPVTDRGHGDDGYRELFNRLVKRDYR